MDNSELKRIVEAILFANGEPVSINEIHEALDGVDGRTIRAVIDELKDEYTKENRSFRVIEVAGGFQMSTDPLYGPWLKKMRKSSQSNRLSGPSLETLAIIAYRQSVTRAEIEFIRGVNVDGVIKNLMDRSLIKITGRKEVVGRPILYGTTKEFLQYFGLNSLAELPKLKEFSEADIQLPVPNDVAQVESLRDPEDTPKEVLHSGKTEAPEGESSEEIEVSVPGETQGTD